MPGAGVYDGPRLAALGDLDGDGVGDLAGSHPEADKELLGQHHSDVTNIISLSCSFLANSCRRHALYALQMVRDVIGGDVTLMSS